MAEINSFQIGSTTYDMRDERTKQNLASVFSTGVAYEAGDYAEYDTQLYQFIVDHPAGAWDASQVVAVNLAAGVSEALKSRENFSTKAPVILNTASGDIVSFADGADGMPIKKIVGTIVPIQGGTGNPAPDNVRTIRGWTGMHIGDAGVNWLDQNFMFDAANYSISGQYSYKYTPVFYLKPNTTYYFSLPWIDSTAFSFPNFIFAVHRNFDMAVSAWKQNISIINSNGSKGSSFSFTTGPTGAVRFAMVNATAEKLAEVKSVLSYVQINLGASALPYEPYKSQTLSITFTDPTTGDPLTVYDGTVTLNEDGSVDVISEWAMKEFDGSDDEGWTGSTNNRQYISVTPKPYYRYYEDSHILCDKLVSRSSQGSTGAWYACFIYGEYTIGVHINSETSAATIKTWLAENPITVIYRMDVPQTYHFGNIGELYTYFGINNVWIDTGSITECDYPADTKLFLTARDKEITENIAPIENSATASQAYAQGAYFWHDAKFCKALTAIASGATFTLNTNYVETTVAAELLAAQN